MIEVFPPRLNTRQAARFVGLSPRTLEKRRRMSSNDPPFLKIGRSVRYDITALTAWLLSKSRASTSDPGTPKGAR